MKLFVCALVALVFVPASVASSKWEPDPVATPVAQVFAERSDVAVQCYAPDEDASPAGYGAWGYTMPLVSSVVYLDGPTICAGIDAIASDDPAVPDWEKALGALVLVHESYHLRHWRWYRDEARVECQAVRHWRYTVRMLGASTAEANRLFPWGLWAHWHLAAFAPEYNWPSCIVPEPS